MGVVVLDVTLGDLSGIEVLRRLHAERPSLRVIVLSDHTDQDLVLEALWLQWVLPPPLAAPQLVAHLRQVVLQQ